MLRYLFLLLLVLPAERKQLPGVDLEGLKQILAHESDSVYVLNFWATWCKPCLEEMPAFAELHRDTSYSKVKIMLLSLDSRKRLPDSTMIGFLKRRDIPVELVSYLEAGDPNLWMGLVNKDWDGAIPATLIMRKGEKPVFINESVTAAVLKRNIKQLYR